MPQYIDKDIVKAELERMLQNEYPCDNSEQETGYDCALYELQDFLDTLEVKEVNIADMADEYYDALMEEAVDWMDEGTMGHCRLAYYTGCKDVLAKLQKGDNV